MWPEALCFRVVRPRACVSGRNNHRPACRRLLVVCSFFSFLSDFVRFSALKQASLNVEIVTVIYISTGEMRAPEQPLCEHRRHCAL